MSEQHWPCSTREQFDAFVAHVVESWDFAKPLLIKWSVGEKRSLGQNALVHVWFRAIANHLNSKQKACEYTEEDLKDYLKKTTESARTLLTRKPARKCKNLNHLVSTPKEK